MTSENQGRGHIGRQMHTPVWLWWEDPDGMVVVEKSNFFSRVQRIFGVLRVCGIERACAKTGIQGIKGSRKILYA